MYVALEPALILPPPHFPNISMHTLLTAGLHPNH